MEENILKGALSNKAESLKNNDKQEPVGLIESENDINKELENEGEKLAKNLEGFEKEVAGFKNEEELADSLKKNPGIAKRIFNRATIIAPSLVMITGMATSSLHENFQNGDYIGLATILFSIFATSGVISAAIEAFKKPNKKEHGKFYKKPEVEEAILEKEDNRTE